jgi:hypothetical protein
VHDANERKNGPIVYIHNTNDVGSYKHKFAGNVTTTAPLPSIISSLLSDVYLDYVHSRNRGGQKGARILVGNGLIVCVVHKNASRKRGNVARAQCRPFPDHDGIVAASSSPSSHDLFFFCCFIKTLRMYSLLETASKGS